jgi:hypothetical protein
MDILPVRKVSEVGEAISAAARCPLPAAINPIEQVLAKSKRPCDSRAGTSECSGPITTLPDTFGPTKAKNPVEYGSMLKIDFTRGIPNTPPHYNGAPGQDYLIAPSHHGCHGLIKWGAGSRSCVRGLPQETNTAAD